MLKKTNKIWIFSLIIIISSIISLNFFDIKKLIDPISRFPSSNNNTISKDLDQLADQFINHIQSLKFNPHTCKDFLDDSYKQLFNLPSSHFDLTLIENKMPQVLNKVWLSRMLLRNKMKEFHSNHLLREECAVALKSAFRAARYIEDFLGTMIVKPTPYNPDKRKKILTGGFPWILRNPDSKYKNFSPNTDIKSGDIIISRGNAFSSAAIARLGETDTQFSHLSLVYVDRENIDPQTKRPKAYTIEAHIEIGVVVAPLKKNLTNENNRAAIFRYHDSEVAHRAAEYMFNLAKNASDNDGNIPYDFKFDGLEHNEIFCSEVAIAGFEYATDGKIQLPLFKSNLTMKNPTFLEALGIEAETGFIPADIFVDPRFDLIAEWRDFSRMRDNHIKDAILTKIFQWMDDYGYEFRTSAKSFVLSNTIYYLRNWPLWEMPMVSKQFPRNMSKKTFQAIIILRQVGTKLQKALQKIDNKFLIKNKIPMSPIDLYGELDRIRIKDLKKYKIYKTHSQLDSDEAFKTVPLFHQYFRPSEI